MIVTLQDLLDAPVLSTVKDVSSDEWVKNQGGDWDCPSGGTSDYQGWTSERLHDQYNRHFNNDLHDLTYPLEQPKMIDPQELADWYATEYPTHANGEVLRRLRERFSLPAPTPKKQFMELTLKIPVVGLDRLGDTYTMGRCLLRDYLDAGDSQLLEYIETVEITEL